jgi:hypothetical protein
MDRFVWEPGVGIDGNALARLRTHFERPKEPMGEAWFMGDNRRMFHELDGDLSHLSAWTLQEPLQEIASGTSSFGPLPEWHSWYNYLLSQLIPRSHESFVSSLLESLITGFVAIYPNGVQSGPYPLFLEDSLLTLGRCMMESRCWSGTDVVVGEFLHRSNNNPNRVWCWWDASGDFSASMFFCLKYLPPALIPGWLESALAIPSPHWRAQLIVWLVGSHDILTGKINWPSEFPDNAYPSVNWEWSHCLRPELAASDSSGASPIPSLLGETSRSEALRVIHSHFSEDVFLEWLSSISGVSYLETELADIPSTFEGLYVHAK